MDNKQCIEWNTRHCKGERIKEDEKRFDDAPLKPNLMGILMDLWVSEEPYEYIFNNENNASSFRPRREAKWREHDREIIALTHDLGLVRVNTSYKQAAHPDDPYIVWLMLTPLGYKFCSEHFKDPERLKHLWKSRRTMRAVSEILAWISVIVIIYALIANFCFSAVISALDLDLGDPATSQSYGILTGFAIGFVILTLIAVAVTLYFRFVWSRSQHNKVTLKSLITYILDNDKKDGEATSWDVAILGSIASVAFDMNK